MQAICLALFLAAAGVSAETLGHTKKGRGSIGEVIEKLELMQTDSEAEWKTDETNFGLFGDYCKTNKDLQTQAIAAGVTAIALLTNKIDETQGTIGKLSVENAKLKVDIAENEQARESAMYLRNKENAAFLLEQTDLNQGVDQMILAINKLAEIGADQSASRGADNKQFMANYNAESLLGVHVKVQQALFAANSLLDPEKQKKVAALIQAPTYSAQSGQIVGILKDMRDTFQSNLATAVATEAESLRQYTEFKTNKLRDHKEMEDSYDEKEGQLGSLDGVASSKKGLLTTEKGSKVSNEGLLADLGTQCDDKVKDFEKRRKFAENEGIALAKAISILSSYADTEAFKGDVATNNAAAAPGTNFLQLSSSSNNRAAVVALLQGKSQQSPRVRQVLLLLQVGNPFTVVLEKIDTLKKLSEKEQSADDAQKAYCTKTNTANDRRLEEAEQSVEAAQDAIDGLKFTIDDPAEGLKYSLSQFEESLKTSLENQASQTTTRRSENDNYQKDSSTLKQALAIISKAETVLQKYYDALDNEVLGLIQVQRELPAAPTIYSGAYRGQNEQAQAIFGLLQTMASDTRAEVTAEHDAELNSQHAYEDSMKLLTEGEATAQRNIIETTQGLTQAEKELAGEYTDQTAVQNEETEIKRYIAKLKPGCDFILDNHDERSQARTAEQTALAGAVTKLQATPSFQAATNAAYGECEDTCVEDSAHVKCKACVAKVSIPGYCAGHAGTPGCASASKL